MPPLFSSMRISESDKWENLQGARLWPWHGFRKMRRLAPALAEVKTETRYAIGWPIQIQDALRTSERAVCSIRTQLTPWTEVHHRTENFPTSWPSRKYDNSAASYTWLYAQAFARHTPQRDASPRMRDATTPRDVLETGNERPASQNELIRPARSIANSNMLCLVIDHRFCLKHALARREEQRYPAKTPKEVFKYHATLTYQIRTWHESRCTGGSTYRPTKLVPGDLGFAPPFQQEQGTADWPGPVPSVIYPGRLPTWHPQSHQGHQSVAGVSKDGETIQPTSWATKVHSKSIDEKEPTATT
ncbi:hypothetical protein EDB89DRAFT_1910624 [Lactarius sanguifluus]|nr:hypothetical protein EDB89DRAFT_1910624 [Lactarius sanguifluus]